MAINTLRSTSLPAILSTCKMLPIIFTLHIPTSTLLSQLVAKHRLDHFALEASLRARLGPVSNLPTNGRLARDFHGRQCFSNVLLLRVERHLQTHMVRDQYCDLHVESNHDKKRWE